MHLSYLRVGKKCLVLGAEHITAACVREECDFKFYLAIFMSMGPALVIGCLLLLATGSKAISAEGETPFTVSSGMPTIFLGEDKNNPSAQSELRAKLGMLLDTVEAHYNGLLHKAHELNDPRVASLMKVCPRLPRSEGGRTGWCWVRERTCPPS